MKTLLFTILFCLSLAPAFSQMERGEKIESLRIAYITKQLQLSPDEAKVFWPVYNIYEQEMKTLLQDHRQKGGSELDFQEKKLNLRKRYKAEFVKVISEAKFDRLIQVEEAWGDLLRKEIQRRRENGGPGGGGFRKKDFPPPPPPNN